MKIKVLKPKNDKYYSNVLTLLEGTEQEQFYLFVDFFCNNLITKHYNEIKNNTYCKNNKYKNYLSIHRNLLETLFNVKTLPKIMKIMVEENFLNIKHNYSNGENPFCKEYELNFFGDFVIEEIEIELKYKKNIDKVLNNYTCKDDIKDEDFNIQKNFMSRLTFDLELVDNTIKQLYKEKIKEYKTNDITDEKGNLTKFGHFRNYIINQKNRIEKYNILHLKTYSVGDKSGRLFSFLTNVKKELRKCLFLQKSNLCELDITSSQIVMLVNIKNMDLSQYDLDLSKIDLDEEFIKLTLEGKIYEFFVEKSKLSRDVVKKKLLTFMYGGDKRNDVVQLLKKHFTKTYNTIIYLLNIRIENFIKKTNNHGKMNEKSTFLAILLQKTERDIIFDSIKNKKDIYTIHDSIVFEKGREEEFRNSLAKEFERRNFKYNKLNVKLYN